MKVHTSISEKRYFIVLFERILCEQNSSTLNRNRSGKFQGVPPSQTSSGMQNGQEGGFAFAYKSNFTGMLLMIPRNIIRRPFS